MMNNVSSVQHVEYQEKTTTPKRDSKQILAKDDFLTLLVTQLKNQDPLKPMDPTEFTAQLAQFTSLEQLYNVNENLQILQSIQGDFDRLAALSMIDKSIVTESNTFHFEGETVELGFYFQEKVSDINLFVKDMNGQAIRHIAVSEPVSEEHFLSWDGKDQDGNKVSKGDYSIEVIGTNGDGEVMAGSTLVRSRITGVDFSDIESTLITTSGKVKVSDITEVKNSTSPANIE